MITRTSTSRRWRVWLGCLPLLGVVAIAGTASVPAVPTAAASPPSVTSPVDDVRSAAAATTNPNQPDPELGAPRQPLPASPAGTASNQNGKQFPHYGRIEIKLCELPRGFSGWDGRKQQRWMRAELVRRGFAMPPSFTQHELVESIGGRRVLAVYRVDAKDHAPGGRPRLYHPPDPAHPGTKAYLGGLAQMTSLPAAVFSRKRPPLVARPTMTTTATTAFADENGTLAGATGSGGGSDGGVGRLPDGGVGPGSDGGVVTGPGLDAGTGSGGGPGGGGSGGGPGGGGSGGGSGGDSCGEWCQPCTECAEGTDDTATWCSGGANSCTLEGTP